MLPCDAAAHKEFRASGGSYLSLLSTWINVLSQAHRLSSGLTRLPDFQAVIESWGPAGRQKAVEYLKPLAQDIQAILSALSSDRSHATVDP
jgi:hypothetical protein